MTKFDITQYEIIFSEPDRIKTPYSWVGHIPFAYLIVKLIKPSILVELGVHSGNSYNAYCQAVKKLGLNTICYGVDTWEGDEQAGYYGNEVFEDLLQYHEKNYAAFSNLLRMTFDQALEYFSDHLVDLLHIDGCHTYEAVKHDFEAWLPKMKGNGVVIFHDIHVRERDFGVWRLWEDLKKSYKTIEFNHAHGLGILFLDAGSKELEGFIDFFQTNSFTRHLLENIGQNLLQKADLKQTLEGQKRQIELQTAELDHRSALINEKNARLESLQKEINDRTAQLAERESQLHDRNQNLAAYSREIQLISAHMSEQHKDLTARANEIERLKNVLLLTERDLDQAYKHMEHLNQHIGHLNHTIEQHRQIIEEITSSTSWKLSHPLRLLGSMARKMLAYIRTLKEGSPAPGEEIRAEEKAALSEEERAAEKEEEEIEEEQTQEEQEPLPDDYQRWIAKNQLTEEDLSRIRQEIDAYNYKPLISIIVPVYNTDQRWLTKCIQSVQNQLYTNWELCIADDASTDTNVKTVLDHFAQDDERIKVVYRTENGHISAASNSAFELAEGEFVALLDHDDELSIDALYENVKLLNENPDADLIYSDEDKINEAGERHKPFFKPDWSPDTLLSHNYICHFSLYRASIFKEIGGFREGFEGSQDYDLVLRFTEKTDKIYHIPKILYHWRTIEGSAALSTDAKEYAYDAATRALEEAFERRGEKAQVELIPNYPGQYSITYNLQHEPLISVIVPTRDGHQLLDNCLKSLYNKTSYSNYEIIVADNGSTEEETFELFNRWQSMLGYKFRVLRLDMPFNYSKINNLAVQEARGELLLLLNNDTEVITPDWMRKMAGQAVRKSIGAVGAKLLYPDNTIQHSGCILGIGGVASHSHKYIHVLDPGYFGRLLITANYAAVTGACLMIKKDLYERVGGFDEELAVAFNDIDFCIRLLEEGYYNVSLGNVLLYHYEHKSRGDEDSPEKLRRFLLEIDTMKKRWGKLLQNDPFYNPNLTLGREDYSIRL